MTKIDKIFKKRLFGILDTYGVFNDKPFIKDEYRNGIYRDLLALLTDMRSRDNGKKNKQIQEIRKEISNL